MLTNCNIELFQFIQLLSRTVKNMKDINISYYYEGHAKYNVNYL